MNRESLTWILNGVLCTQNDSRETLRAHLLVRNGIIEKITDQAPLDFGEATLIDAKGLTILPGFVQAHLHLCQTLFRNQADDLELLDWLSKRVWVMEAAHTEETLYTSALVGIRELISSGTTCVLDMGTVRHTEAILHAVRETGIRASVGKCLMDHPTRNPKYLQESTAAALKEATTLYSKWHKAEKDRIRISLAPRFAISCTEELLVEVARFVKNEETLIHTHASENQKEVQTVRELFGKENIEYLHHLGLTSDKLVLAHAIWTHPQEKEILRATRTRVVHCPHSNLKLASGIAPIPEYQKLGITVALGTDGAACNNSLNMFSEMRLAALLQKPFWGPRTLKAQEVLDMATREGAKALNWFKEIGSIEVGKKADLIALDLQTPFNLVPESRSLETEAIASSLVYSCQPHHLSWTMIDGRVVYDQRRDFFFQDESFRNRVKAAQKLILSALEGNQRPTSLPSQSVDLTH